MQLCTFLIAVLATMPADAGGVRSTVPNHIGRSVSHAGVAIFYRIFQKFSQQCQHFRSTQPYVNGIGQERKQAEKPLQVQFLRQKAVKIPS